MLEHVWIIPALMALSFVLILAIGKRTPGKGHFIGIGFVAIAFVLSIVTGAQWISRSGEVAHSQASALRDVDPSCSARAGELAAEGGGHGTEAEAGEKVHQHILVIRVCHLKETSLLRFFGVTTTPSP
jgi:hypothetical protein